ncbi:tetraacyldisaccharide 4'-kinase, partial [Bordetella holmesii]|uniref:tetraacyldisaccharide 4'-kinase n=1 Tax=Bordetella holmesii TaxID=35814 RepID=UPI000459F0D0
GELLAPEQRFGGLVKYGRHSNDGQDIYSGALFGRTDHADGLIYVNRRDGGLVPTPRLALPDHYDYAHSPFGDLHADAIFITTKDAVKCARFNDPRLWAVQVRARFSGPDFLDWLAARLQALPAR